MINISDGHDHEERGFDQPQPLSLSTDTFVEYLGPTGVKLVEDLYSHDLEHPPEDDSIYVLFMGQIESAIADFHNAEVGYYEPTGEDIGRLLDDVQDTLEARIAAGSSNEIVFEEQCRWINYLRRYNTP